uniref:Pentatricopeptide repeat-containing protein n=1 Tax=Quercus lobata TaxID=97700 RepID=A0A7N2LA83_QUELO
MFVSMVQDGHPEKTLNTFVSIVQDGNCVNDPFSFTCAMKACGSLAYKKLALQLHGLVEKFDFGSNAYMAIQNSIMDMYIKSGKSLSTFVDIDVESRCYTEFHDICQRQKYVSIEEQQHGYTIKTGMDSSVAIGNAVVTMYTKCGNVQKENHAFKLMPMRDIISWTAMITAFSKIGDIEKPRQCFDQMPEQNVITWNSMLGTYTQHGFWEEGLKLFTLMQRQGVKPDWVTFATSSSACADLAILKLGIHIVSQAEKLGFGSNVSVANNVVSMYSRYAQNGQGRKVIEIFENMLEMKCSPDHISYVSVLSGCSHAGLVTEGKQYFYSMTEDFGISPTSERFSCMVDLLGRAGLLEEAKNLIDGMPFKPNDAIWGALLGACQIHCESKLADVAMKNSLEFDVEESEVTSF